MGKFMDIYNDMINKGMLTYTSSDQDLKNKPQPITIDELREKMGFPKVDDNQSNAVKRFELINEECARIFAKKNKDYGNSFDVSLDEDGLVAAKFRIGDKYRRFSQLIKNDAEVTDESIRDTLLDMANYAKMTVMWLDAKDQVEQKKHDDSLDAMRYQDMCGPQYSIEDIIKSYFPNGLTYDGKTFRYPAGVVPTTCGADMDGDKGLYPNDWVKDLHEKSVNPETDER